MKSTPSKQQHAFISIVVSLLLPSLVISQHNVSDMIPTHYPTYNPTTTPFNSTTNSSTTHFPTYEPTISFNNTNTTHYPTYEPTVSSNPTTHYPTYEPTASDSEGEGMESIPDSDSEGLGGGDRSITNITLAEIEPDIPQQIVGGEPTNGPVGYQVLVLNECCMCGGSLIAPKVVLTAAHCLFDLEGTGNRIPTTKVFVNLYDVKDDKGEGVDEVILSPSPGVWGENVIVHPNYDYAGNDNDIALIFLPRGVAPVDGVFAKLNEDANKPVDNAELRVTGWGRTTGGGQSSDILLKAQLDYMTNEECQKSFKSTITEGMLCAAKDEKSACNGDSGGPLMLVNEPDVQVGIVSFGGENCPKGGPNVFTRVSNYVEWIKKTVCDKLTGDPGAGELCATFSPTRSLTPIPTPSLSPSPTRSLTPIPTPSPTQFASGIGKAGKGKGAKGGKGGGKSGKGKAGKSSPKPTPKPGPGTPPGSQSPGSPPPTQPPATSPPTQSPGSPPL